MMVINASKGENRSEKKSSKLISGMHTLKKNVVEKFSIKNVNL